MTRRIVFVDVETTGLDPRRHEVWEIATVERSGPARLWYPELNRQKWGQADPTALEISGFWQRRESSPQSPREVAALLSDWLGGVTFAGANPAFDDAFLSEFVRRHQYPVTWHHRLLDVPVYVAGALGLEPGLSLSEAAEAVGIDVSGYERHTALGDARLVRDVYQAVREGRGK